MLVPTLLPPAVKDNTTIATPKPVEKGQPTGKPKVTPTPTLASENTEKGLKESDDMDIDEPSQRAFLHCSFDSIGLNRV